MDALAGRRDSCSAPALARRHRLRRARSRSCFFGGGAAAARHAPLPAAAPPKHPAAGAARRASSRAQTRLAVLRTERHARRPSRVRAAIWRMVGAGDGETLADVLRTTAIATDDAMRRLLIALERSAFTYDADLHAAIDDACIRLDRSGPASAT